MCSVRVEQCQDRNPDAPTWTVHPPHVHLEIIRSDDTAGVWLTTTEAFELAEMLTDAVHQADTEIARCER